MAVRGKASGSPALVLLIRGGNANNGSNDGAFYGNWNNTASNSNWNYAARPHSLDTHFDEVSASHRKAHLPQEAAMCPYPLVKINAARKRVGTRLGRLILEDPCRQERGAIYIYA